MKVREFQSWGVCFRKRWEDNFENHVSDEKKKCLEGKEAENTFHNEGKKECYIFYQHCDDVLLIKDASLLSMDDMYKGDIYIVDREFTWTFVKTHEHRWCGPYFAKKC